MRISDWSSDVCSSDLRSSIASAARLLAASMRDNPLHRQVFGAEEARLEPLLANAFARLLRGQMEAGCVLGAYEDDVLLGVAAMVPPDHCNTTLLEKLGKQIERASCRERVCQYV